MARHLRGVVLWARLLLQLRLALLVCVAAMSMPAIADAAPMQFSLGDGTVEDRLAAQAFNGGQVAIYASGDIDEAASVRFRSFVRANGIKWGRVNFNSSGGSLIGGIQLGETIRELRFDSEVASSSHDLNRPVAICASACVYAFVGGINRYVHDSTGKLGIHQFYVRGSNVGDIGDTQIMSGLIVSYLARMGVGAKVFSTASMASSQEIIWLTQIQSEVLELVNNGSTVTTAEIKMLGITPYLRLEQTNSSNTSRVLLMCDVSGIRIGFGIVTRSDVSASKLESLQRSYFEFDYEEAMPLFGRDGARAEENVLWIDRVLDTGSLRLLLTSDELDAWTENGGPMRWGGRMTIRQVRPAITEFVRNCLSK